MRHSIFLMNPNSAEPRFPTEPPTSNTYVYDNENSLLIVSRLSVGRKILRRDRDSNPGYSHPYAAFRVRSIRPLWHLSLAYFAFCQYPRAKLLHPFHSHKPWGRKEIPSGGQTEIWPCHRPMGCSMAILYQAGEQMNALDA